MAKKIVHNLNSWDPPDKDHQSPDQQTSISDKKLCSCQAWPLTIPRTDRTNPIRGNKSIDRDKELGSMNKKRVI